MNGSRNRVLIDAGEAWRWSCAVLAKPFKGGLQLTVSQSGQCRTDQTDRQFPLPRARGETVRSRLDMDAYRTALEPMLVDLKSEVIDRHFPRKLDPRNLKR